MRTHNDVVQRAAFRVGLRRADQDLSGSVYVELEKALRDFLLELDEQYPLDFDPTDADVIPEERMGTLVPLFMMSPVFDQFDRRRTAEARELLSRVYRRRFFAAVVGDSDFAEDVPRDF